jgi:hypothetical protein
VQVQKNVYFCTVDIERGDGSVNRGECWLSKYSEVMVFKAKRVEMFQELLVLWEQYRHKN